MKVFLLDAKVVSANDEGKYKKFLVVSIGKILGFKDNEFLRVDPEKVEQPYVSFDSPILDHKQLAGGLRELADRIDGMYED